MKTNLTTLLILALTSSAFSQGLLTPPPTGGQAVGVAGPLGPSGEPMPTMKTLHQIEPRHDLLNGPWGVPMFVDISHPSAHYIINKPGSYYLSDNLAVIKGAGIIIAVDNVTLDMRGFTIQRDTGATAATTGIRLASGVSGVKIHDGTFSGLATGISTDSPMSSSIRVQMEKLAFNDCTTSAVTIEAPASPAPNLNVVQMSGCMAENCGAGTSAASVLHLDAQTQISDSSVSDSAALTSILTVGASSRVSGVSILSSTGAGAAIALSTGSVAEGCIVNGWNGSSGIEGSDVSVSRCNVKAVKTTAWTHETAAFSIDRGTVSGCHASACTIAWGFDVKNGKVTDCSAHGIEASETATSLWGGFRLRVGTTISECVSTEHGGTGGLEISEERRGIGFMLAGEGVRLMNSSVSDVQGACILSEAGHAVIEGNHTSGGHTGIWLGEDDKYQTVARNSVKDSSYGITILSEGCRVHQNVFMHIGVQICNIISGNQVALFEVHAGSPAITGAGVGSGFTSTDPWANWVH
jgi:hypothetical protein